jgi:hypothetical protein
MDIIEFVLPVLTALGASFMAGYGLNSKLSNGLNKMDNRVTELETKMEPFWIFVTNHIPKILASGTPVRMKILLKKFENKSLYNDEATELCIILKKEYDKAQIDGKLAIGLLIALLESRVNFNNLNINQSKMNCKL